MAKWLNFRWYRVRAWVPFALPNVAVFLSWKAAALALAVLAVAGTLRLLAERERRKTFATLTAGRPAGTVVVQREGPSGQSMMIWLGNDEAPEPPRRHE